jgi:HAD superfamily hydrolase (TIGR01509 family)
LIDAAGAANIDTRVRLLYIALSRHKSLFLVMNAKMRLKQGIEAFVFDCDGVMFDSRQANINFYNHLLMHFGLPPLAEDDVAFVHMHTADQSIRHIFRETPFVEPALSYRLQMDYTPFIKDMIMEPGLKALLKALKGRFRLAVATNRSNTIGYVLKTYALEAFFEIVVSSLDVENPKPHPEPLLKILDFFRLAPEQAVYVGDSAVDSETAKAAGVLFMAYKNGDLEADYHVDSFVELRRLIG